MVSPSDLLKNLREELALFGTIKKGRQKRKRPRILIIEDQLFSRKLISQFLKTDFDVDLAATAFEGIKLYLESAPDMTFLDIELEGQSGHLVASIIQEIDDKPYVVMVTGNQTANDVATAKKNKVAGYIVKPYSKKKIFESIEGYYALNPDKKQEG